MLTINIMKDLNKIFLITCVLFLSASCKDILDEDAPDYLVNEANVFGDPALVRQAVTGMYDPISWGQNTYTSGGFSHSYEFVFGDICSDNALKGSESSDQVGIQQLKSFIAEPGNQNVIAVWNKFWAAIARANLVIKNIRDANIPEADKLVYEGDARFIRAYSYLNLITIFGGQPTFMEPVSTDEINARSFSKDPLYINYQLIESDLSKAVDLLPTNGVRDPGYATKGAAAAYLSRAIMYQIGTDNTNEHTWDEVLEITDSFITGNYGSYALASNFASIFELEGENNIESIFEIQAVDNALDAGNASTGAQWTVFQNPQFLSGWGFNTPTADLANAYEVNDPRRPATTLAVGEYAYGVVMQTSIRNQTGYYHRKAIAEPDLWVSGTTAGNTEKGSFQNIRKFRYADVLLMNAEAAFHTNNQGQAKTRLEEIRNRASGSTYPKGWDITDPFGYPATGLAPLDNNIVQVASGQALLDLIKLERRRELGMETTRFYDLVRWGEYENAIRTTYFDEYDASNTGYANEVASNMLVHSLSSSVKESNEQVIVNTIPLFPIPGFDAVGWGITQNVGY